MTATRWAPCPSPRGFVLKVRRCPTCGQPLGVHLTARQVDILRLVAQGLTSAEIGARLGLTKRGVEQQRKAICERLGASNSAHAVTLAFTRGLFERGEPEGD